MFKNRERMKKVLSMVILTSILLSSILGAFSYVAFAAESEKTIRLVHVNDVHGRVKLDEREGAIGYGRLKAKLDELKEENPNTLLINAGDTVHGTTLVNVTRGETMIKLMNLVGFDLMVPGNHDFNYGYERLVELKDMAEFPILTANVVRENGERDFDGYMVKDIDGVKLGFFGVTTEETVFKSHPDNTKGVEFIDPVEAAKDAVAALEKEDVDVIVGVVHMGIEGTTLTTTRDILDNVEGIDIMIDGHSHEETNEMIGDTLLVQAGEYTKNLGLVEIRLEDGAIKDRTAKLIGFEEVKDLTPDEEIEKAIDKIDEINKPILDVVVGETKVHLDGEREDVRTRETNLGNLVADAMLHGVEGDIAFTNGGGIRASIKKGDVRVEDIITTVPFTNTLAVIEATGAEILEALERGVDSYPEAAGHFPHVSGMTYSYNPEKEVGNRVVEVKVAGEAIDPEGVYKVVTNDFIAAGGDGYTMFEGKNFVAEGGLLSDVLRAYIEDKKVIEPKVEGRITVLDEAVERPEGITIKINEEVLTIPAEFGEVFIEEGRTMVPVRAISEGLGHEVEWDRETRTAIIDGEIKLAIGEKEVLVGEEKLEMDVPAQIIDGRTYLPLRFVSEALGYEVKWDKVTRTVTIVKEVVEVKPAA